MVEIPLDGGSRSTVVRVGQTVRRASHSWSPAVLDLLRHLECEGFAGAPRALGVDDQGREVLTYIRHRLTASLREIGGHIGYDIRPSARRHGHATAMLAAALPVARSLGIDRALLTCDADNLGSRKVIEANGGVLEDKSGDTVRYWVPTG